MKNYILLLLLCILSCTCRVKESADIYPIRTLTVQVLAGKDVTCHDVARLFLEVNDCLIPQVGIALTIKECTDRDKDMPADIVKAGNHLVSLYPKPTADIVLWADNDISRRLKEGLISIIKPIQPAAIIDDIYRRYIVLRVINRLILLHEIGHAFIFSHQHSGSGVMKPYQLQLLPGIYINPTCNFNETDRQEILKNKFRDFSEKIKFN